ncbi:MAG: MFS transporter [Bacteroidetes bacterium]|nr:MFS transporter [Bacteroidota bacterium]
MTILSPQPTPPIMSLSSTWRSAREGFLSIFWVANILELFERLAFYGSKAVLAVYIADRVGLTEEAGTLTGLFSGLIYLLPVLAGVVVDRYGFRKALITCFGIFAIGYFLIGLAGIAWGQEIADAIGRKTYMIIVLVLTAVGGSLIKPCIVGTVAVTSRDDVRPLGFSIYYTLVNIGGAIGPILALQIRKNMGIEYVLMMSALTSVLLMVGTMIFFREPEKREEAQGRTFGKVFSDMLLVFGNLRFILFLVIFSGFWTMFWQIFYSFPFYVKDVLHFEDFELLETVDAITIIFLTVPMAALVKTWKPFTAMTVGFVISGLSWIIIALTGTVMGAIIGVAVYAVGEAMQSPRFYDYVSSLAPRDQVGTYMGFAFLPVAIGSFTAGPLADWLRKTYMATEPSQMWLVVSGIGMGSAALMVLYNFLLVKDKPAEG